MLQTPHWNTYKLLKNHLSFSADFLKNRNFRNAKKLQQNGKKQSKPHQ